MNWLRIALGVACAAVLSTGVATAAVAPSTAPLTTEMEACHKLPVSERGICKAQATRHFDAVVAASEPAPVAGAANGSAQSCARLPVSERGICATLNASSQAPELTAAQRTALRSEDARYRVATAACHNLPVSERGICVNEQALKLEAAEIG